MREQGFFTDLRHEMNQYEATIFRAARIIVDTSLHMGEMSWGEAVTFMTSRTGLTEPTAHRQPRDRPNSGRLLRGPLCIRHRCAARLP